MKSTSWPGWASPPSHLVDDMEERDNVEVTSSSCSFFALFLDGTASTSRSVESILWRLKLSVIISDRGDPEADEMLVRGLTCGE